MPCGQSIVWRPAFLPREKLILMANHEGKSGLGASNHLEFFQTMETDCITPNIHAATDKRLKGMRGCSS